MTPKLLTGILALALLAGCYRDSNKYIQTHRNDIITARPAADSVSADGKSVLLITARINDNADYKTVQFITNHGRFLDSSIVYTATATFQSNQLVAQAYLVPSIDTTSFVAVKAVLQGVDTILHIRFVTAYAEKVHIETDSAALKKDPRSTAPIRVALSRSAGVPSLRQAVNLVALNDKNDTVSGFINISPNGSDSTGTIRATFQLRDTSNIGKKVRIYVNYTNPSMPIPSDTATILIN